MKSENLKKLAMFLFMRVCLRNNQFVIACQASPFLSTLIGVLSGVLQPLCGCSTSCLDVCLQAMAIHGKSACTVTLHCPYAKHNKKHINRCAMFRPHPFALGASVSCGAKPSSPYQTMFVSHGETGESSAIDFFFITDVIFEHINPN